MKYQNYILEISLAQKYSKRNNLLEISSFKNRVQMLSRLRFSNQENEHVPLEKVIIYQPESGLPITTFGVKIYNPRMQELLIGAS